MHYYQFNIGDYKSHTGGLSLLEDIAYRRLLDLYYLNERPFNGCSTDVAREIGMREHPDEVEYILNKYFPKRGDNWVNKRAENEISNFKKKKKTAAAAGRASGKARRSKGSERAFDSVQPTINHKPLTSNDKPDKNSSPGGESGDPKAAPVPYQKIIDLYHETLPKLPKVAKLSEKRKRAIRARWKDDADNLDYWREYFKHAASSKFIHGQNDRGWVADIDFMIREDVMIKMQEGKYHG